MLYLASTDPHRDPIFRTDLKFWDIETEREVGVVGVVEDVKETYLSASSNRDWIASFNPWSSGSIRLWHTSSKKEIAQFPVNSQVKSLSFHPNADRFAIISGGTTIEDGKCRALQPSLPPPTSPSYHQHGG